MPTISHYMHASFTDSDKWKRKRDANLAMARRNRDCLQEMGRSATEIHDGTEFWVERAKHCHAVALRRVPAFNENGVPVYVS